LPGYAKRLDFLEMLFKFSNKLMCLMMETWMNENLLISTCSFQNFNRNNNRKVSHNNNNKAILSRVLKAKVMASKDMDNKVNIRNNKVNTLNKANIHKVHKVSKVILNKDNILKVHKVNILKVLKVHRVHRVNTLNKANIHKVHKVRKVILNKVNILKVLNKVNILSKDNRKVSGALKDSQAKVNFLNNMVSISKDLKVSKAITKFFPMELKRNSQ